MKFICIHCQEEVEYYNIECPLCGHYFSIVSSPVPVKFERKTRIRSALHLTRQKLLCTAIPKFDILGDVCDKFGMSVFGPAGQGKSTFCMLFGAAIAEYRQKNTLYVSGEEGTSTTFIKKIHGLGICSKRFMVTDSSDFDLVMEDVKESNAHTVIFDSQTVLNYSWPQLKKIATQISGPWVLILHSTKDKDYRGSTDLAHTPDIIISVENGIAVAKKNRFGPTGATYNIFDKWENSKGECGGNCERE